MGFSPQKGVVKLHIVSTARVPCVCQ